MLRPLSGLFAACLVILIGSHVASAYDAPVARPAPWGQCSQAVSWVDGAARCDASGTAISPVQALLLGVRMDLNRASAADLEALPAVGETIAQRIVRQRPFSSLEQLTRVRGIGPGTLARLRPYLKI